MKFPIPNLLRVLSILVQVAVLIAVAYWKLQLPVADLARPSFLYWVSKTPLFGHCKSFNGTTSTLSTSGSRITSSDFKNLMPQGVEDAFNLKGVAQSEKSKNVRHGRKLAQSEVDESQLSRPSMFGFLHNDIAARFYHTMWGQMYGLNTAGGPPDTIEIGPFANQLKWECSKPGHLQECTRLTDLRMNAESLQEDGSPPAWTNIESDGSGPMPPWIRGGDDDNLPLTRKVQRDIWVHQFTTNCSSPSTKFLLHTWNTITLHGIGSQIHLAATRLGWALAAGRVFVPLPGSFEMAGHDGCQGNMRGSFSCYFFPFTTAACEARAMELYADYTPQQDLRAAIDSNDLLVVLGSNNHMHSEREVLSVARRWGEPWKKTNSHIEDFGQDANIDDNLRQIGWWYAQAVRFMLRWPTAYLCHLVNIARHDAYGHYVAKHHASDCASLHNLEGLSENEISRLQKVNLTNLYLDQSVWAFEEAYVPRPIVSMHVRQGDKVIEMEISSFALHMWFAKRIRLRAPSVRFIWLSSETQQVIDDTSKFREWRFLYTKSLRQNGADSWNSQSWYEAGRLRIVAEASLVNTLISCESDYFVGALGSNSVRLINELRVTGGRLKAGFMAVNVGEW